MWSFFLEIFLQEIDKFQFFLETQQIEFDGPW